MKIGRSDSDILFRGSNSVLLSRNQIQIRHFVALAFGSVSFDIQWKESNKNKWQKKHQMVSTLCREISKRSCDVKKNIQTFGEVGFSRALGCSHPLAHILYIWTKMTARSRSKPRFYSLSSETKIMNLDHCKRWTIYDFLIWYIYCIIVSSRSLYYLDLWGLKDNFLGSNKKSS